jgi:hypothetical protein
MPDAAGAYRGIRANMEQTSARNGLDHCMDPSGKGTVARRVVMIAAPGVKRERLDTVSNPCGGSTRIKRRGSGRVTAFAGIGSCGHGPWWRPKGILVGGCRDSGRF